MPVAKTTIVVTPRERFAVTQRSLESIYANTSEPFELLYIDAGSPPRIAQYLEAVSQRRGFRLLRRDEYLSGNQARNLGIGEARTKYVVFIENDVVVEPGWLGALVRCAEETGAELAGPLYCEGEPVGELVHMAGGEARIVEENGQRRFIERHRFAHRPVKEIRPLVERGECETVEFHCLLARRDVFDTVGLLDEKIFSASEYIDLCFDVRDAGGKVMFEPEAVVTYLPALCLEEDETEFFRLRWSTEWNRASIARLKEKWRLPDDEPSMECLFQWLEKKRESPHTLETGLVLRFGPRLGKFAAKVISSVQKRLPRFRAA